MNRFQKLQSWPLLALVSVLCLVGTVFAEDNAGPVEGSTTFATPSANQAMSAEQEAQLRAFLAPRLNRSDEGLVEVVEPDGGITMDPQGRFQNVTLMRINADGEVEIGCFNELESAMAFLKFETGPPHVPETATE
jgi:hypothetical protein